MVPSRIRMVLTMLTLLATAGVARAQTSYNSITLTWTAPGDDGSIGTATSYELRYATFALNATNFSTATRWASMPAPAASGTVQTVTITGLTPATTYYFALRATDDAGNVSPISNIATKATTAAPDLTAPAPITVSIASMTDSTATLSWTATGDDSLAGTAMSYDIRYSTAPITSTTWASASQCSGEPAPAIAGTVQSFTVRGLSRQVTYYFAMRAIDDAGNASALSNTPSGTTPDTTPPAAILNLSANFVWMSWHSASARTLPVRGH